MFTGIVQSQAQVISKNSENNFVRLKVLVKSSLISSLEIGASIAINGVCLTAVDFGKYDNNQSFVEFDVIDETLRVTNLGAVSDNGSVNYERSLKVGDEIGGHMVSGHVHTMVELTKIESTELNKALTFRCDNQWNAYILPKGFITLNGVSLTIGKVENNKFTVHLIPETLTRTNIGTLKEGDKVNAEFDQQTMSIVETLKRMKESGEL